MYHFLAIQSWSSCRQFTRFCAKRYPNLLDTSTYPVLVKIFSQLFQRIVLGFHCFQINLQSLVNKTETISIHVTNET